MMIPSTAARFDGGNNQANADENRISSEENKIESLLIVNQSQNNILDLGILSTLTVFIQIRRRKLNC